MDPVNTSAPNNDIFKNVLIAVLVVLLIFSILGINIFFVVGGLFQNLFDFFGPVIKTVAGDLGYASGRIINTTSDVAGVAAKTGVDLVNGSMHNVGDLLIVASKRGTPSRSLDGSINVGPAATIAEYSPSSSDSTIQRSISSGKEKWCLVGEYQNKRGCVSVDDQDKCMSGQVFATQQMCLNPTMTPNPTP
jgi:hypothetical protein